MPQSKSLIALALLSSTVVFFSACTEAKRFLDDKSAAKTSPSPRVSETDVAIKPSPLPSTSPSAKPSLSAAAAFSGDIAGKAGRRSLYELLEKSDKKAVHLDLLLSDEQLAQLDDVDKGKKWYFDLSYDDKDGYNTGGELLIEISKGKGDLKLTGNRLIGNIVVTNWTGPHQGLMSILAKPASPAASNEAASSKPETLKPAASVPAEKKKSTTASNPPN